MTSLTKAEAIRLAKDTPLEGDPSLDMTPDRWASRARSFARYILSLEGNSNIPWDLPLPSLEVLKRHPLPWRVEYTSALHARIVSDTGTVVVPVLNRFSADVFISAINYALGPAPPKADEGG